MPSRFPRLDQSAARTISIASRENKVEGDTFASVHERGASFARFFDSLPKILAGQEIREVVEAIIHARREDKPVIVAMGAHVIKVGLSPILIYLLERGVITALATNGAGAIHDVEVALFGGTSEDVSAGVASGEFGMVKESCSFINEGTKEAAANDCGLGETLGGKLTSCSLSPEQGERAGVRGVPSTVPHRDLSLLAAAHRLNIPMTIHVAIGSDINHMHPDFDGGAAGAATQTDFQIFAAQVAQLQGGGVLMNIGSSVVLPTVIEKAIALSRNLGHDVSGFVGVNLDFIKQYRSGWNPVRRAEELGGKGYALVGHHELLVPLIAAAVVESLPL